MKNGNYNPPVAKRLKAKQTKQSIPVGGIWCVFCQKNKQ